MEPYGFTVQWRTASTKGFGPLVDFDSVHSGKEGALFPKAKTFPIQIFGISTVNLMPTFLTKFDATPVKPQKLRFYLFQTCITIDWL